mgnify:CR=1 FL=1
MIKARFESSAMKSGHDRADSSYGNDLLGLMMAANHQRELKADKKKNLSMMMSISEIIGECKTFFFAGHETTAGLLAWTMVLLSLNQEWQDKARKEVLEICGDKEDLEPNSLSRLKIVKHFLAFIPFYRFSLKFIFALRNLCVLFQNKK